MPFLQNAFSSALCAADSLCCITVTPSVCVCTLQGFTLTTSSQPSTTFHRALFPRHALKDYMCACFLQGYTLTTSSNPSTTFQFPSVSIPANGYILVYTTGKTTAAQNNGDLLTTLPLSKNGGSVVLLDGSGNIASAVQYPRSVVTTIQFPPMLLFHLYCTVFDSQFKNQLSRLLLLNLH